MGIRSLEERAEEIRKKRERAEKRLAQYNEQIKTLEKKAAEESRRQRTHSLIVCGAELAALYGKVLDLDEVHKLVNFLRQQQEYGNFTIENNETDTQEDHQGTIQETKGIDEEIFGDFFDF